MFPRTEQDSFFQLARKLILDKVEDKLKTRIALLEDRVLILEAISSEGLGEKDGPWWVHKGWTPYGDPVQWSSPNGPFSWRALAESCAAVSRAHVVKITSTDVPPELSVRTSAPDEAGASSERLET